MDTSYFTEENIGRLEDSGYLEGRNPHQRKVTLHFSNTRTVIGQLEQSGFQGMEYPLDNLGLAPYGFFLFGYMTEH
jgi:hypothetical protein